MKLDDFTADELMSERFGDINAKALDSKVCSICETLNEKYKDCIEDIFDRHKRKKTIHYVMLDDGTLVELAAAIYDGEKEGGYFFLSQTINFTITKIFFTMRLKK